LLRTKEDDRVCNWFAKTGIATPSQLPFAGRGAQQPNDSWGFWRWRQSPANPSLREFSLLSGKVQGISAASAAGTGSGSVFRTINQMVAAKFPTQKNRELSRENSEFPQRIRECRMSTGDKARSGRRTEIAQGGTIVKKEEAPTGGRGLFEFIWGYHAVGCNPLAERGLLPPATRIRRTGKTQPV